MGKKKDYTWRVTNSAGDVQISFGPKLSEAPFSDDAKIHILGKALIKLGTSLLTSTTGDEDGDD